MERPLYEMSLYREDYSEGVWSDLCNDLEIEEEVNNIIYVTVEISKVSTIVRIREKGDK